MGATVDLKMTMHWIEEVLRILELHFLGHSVIVSYWAIAGLGIRHSARWGSVRVARNLNYKKYQICKESKKIKKQKKSDAGKIILQITDFFKNAKFAFGLAICYFLFEKWGFFAYHFLVTVLISIFSLL